MHKFTIFLLWFTKISFFNRKTIQIISLWTSFLKKKKKYKTFKKDDCFSFFLLKCSANPLALITFWQSVHFNKTKGSVNGERPNVAISKTKKNKIFFNFKIFSVFPLFYHLLEELKHIFFSFSFYLIWMLIKIIKK